MREALGDGYTEALRKAYPSVPASADLVMYWWHKAAQAVRTGRAERFGFITTNSLTQSFNRRVTEYHLSAEPPLALAFAVPDHPWVDAALGAAVRVAMTVGVPGPADGELMDVVREGRGEEDAREVEVTATQGTIRADLSIGADVAGAAPLKANAGISNRGMIPHGAGFSVTDKQVDRLGPRAADILRPYRNGRDVTQKARGVQVIDTHGLSSDDLRDRYPSVYQHLLDEVKPKRDQNKRKSRRENWWLFAEAQPRLRESIVGLSRYIVTPYVSKHHLFVFLDAGILPDDGLIAIASDDAFHFGVLYSRPHEIWALAAGGTLEDRPRYNSSKTFEPFPFPDATEEQRVTIRKLGERIDAHRSRVQAEHPTLTLTGLYNALHALRSGRELSKKERTDYERGQVAILREIHDALDAAVAEAYGWPAKLSGQQILSRLVALNAERQAEEAAGHVRYLRPDFQAPGETTQATLVAAPTVQAAAAEPEPWPSEPADRALALRRILRTAEEPLTVEDAARRFKRAPRAAVGGVLTMLAALGQARQPTPTTFAA
jgi:hypothetical protein